MKVRVRVQSATTSNWVCAHVCVRTLIWTCEVRACDQKNGRNSHLVNGPLKIMSSLSELERAQLSACLNTISVRYQGFRDLQSEAEG